jgi:Protein of unknown function (DUF1592)/Protein of unknown function (DUF1588)/Protein of unknown function (DUF1585)/Protein of unknown function (DUF1595)
MRISRPGWSFRHLVPLAGSLVLAAAAAGCQASISEGEEPREVGGSAGMSGDAHAGSPSGAGVTPADCAGKAPQVGAERIHRLTPREYINSLRVLLGDDTLEPELDADREPIATLDGVRKWFNAADRSVSATPAWLTAVGDCELEDPGCAAVRYEAFAERAFRRPLADGERAWLAAAWARFPAGVATELRLRTMLQLILQAPQFLYIYPESGSAGAVGRLGGYERAERLAYFIWDALPDETLLTAAAGGQLDTAAGMRDQAGRMLSDERAKPVLRSFLAQWLELDGATILPGLDTTPKDPELYPGFDALLRSSMRRELDAFMDYVMFERDGSFDALFNATRAYVNGPLAALYGVAGPARDEEWAWVELNPRERAGMLTRAGFLAVHANQTATSPIRRGVYTLKEVLCFPLPSPPANVDNTPIEVTDRDVADGIRTVRQATLDRTGSASCAACHTAINELGFAFEHYDAVGRWQDTERATGSVVDASANLSHAGAGLDGSVDGALELGARLAKSPEVARCATEKWFEVALRRSPVAIDGCSIATIRGKLGPAPSIRELVLAIAESDAFLNVNHAE